MMTKQTGNSREIELSQEYAQAASGLAATACNNVLGALSVISADPSAIRAITRIQRLNDHARRIHDSLETGESHYSSGDVDAANLEWASALVLMDALSVETLDVMDSHLLKTVTKLQKSGKTG